ncbi:hypothetical protein HOD75_02040 [archaeon]|jgi:hypothetical protein|nr:hypothetical protein [archaeon]MBT4241657.1 hypothetical protein [archaeon]MBT4418052.1 hypothetical protein [archaeon]
MIDLEQIQILSQLIENTEVLSKKLEKAYSSKNSEKFEQAKREIIENQKKIEGLIK